jgi:hypothetical protein
MADSFEILDSSNRWNDGGLGPRTHAYRGNPIYRPTRAGMHPARARMDRPINGGYLAGFLFAVFAFFTVSIFFFCSFSLFSVIFSRFNFVQI